MNYKEFKLQRLDPISPSFCAVKWLTSSFYLHIGTTSSCHYPTPHLINLDNADQDINQFNNINEKIQQRMLMLEGKYPDDCSNCWNAENSGTDVLSERILDSYEVREYDFTKFKANTTTVPALIIVSFDSLCNFACSYCDDTQSSTWASDLKTNGIYQEIVGDSKLTYQKIQKVELVNDYERVFKLFAKYVASNISKVKYINCIGGEPLISPNFWNFMNVLSQLDTKHLTLYVNTNLSNIERLKTLLSYKDKFKALKIQASAENTGLKGEFVRKGFSWDEFKSNLNFLLENEMPININATLSGIALDGFCDFVNYIQNLPNYKNISLFVNKVRHPNFQSMQSLPIHLRQLYADKFENLDIKNNLRLTEQINSIIHILRNDYQTFDNVPIDVLQQSARYFYKEYSKRHNLNIKKTFSAELADWLLS